MKIAVLLLTVTFLTVLSVSLADTQHSSLSHHHGPTDHHVVKHVTHAEGHDDTKKGAKHGTHKHVSKSGKKSEYNQEHGKKGSKEVVNHKTADAEAGGRKSQSHLDDNHQSFKKAAAHSTHDGKAKSGGKQKKANYNKGFREQYHKDEFRKQDSFYANKHKSGEYELYGNNNKKFHSHHHNKDQNGKFLAKKHEDKHGRNGKKLDVYKFETQQGYQHEKGNNKHFMSHNKWAKKNGKHNPVALPLKH